MKDKEINKYLDVYRYAKSNPSKKLFKKGSLLHKIGLEVEKEMKDEAIKALNNISKQ